MNLIYDIDAVPSYLRRYLHLIHQRPDVLDSVVGGGIELVNSVGTAFGKAAAGLAFAAGLHIRGRMGAVDDLGENACGTGFAYTSRAAKQIGVRELVPEYGVFERLRYCVLTDKRPERVRTVLAC